MFKPRAYKRAPLEREAELMVLGSDWTVVKVKNVSPGGCFVQTDLRPHKGEIVGLRFKMADDGGVIEARGQVVGTLGYHKAREGVGLPGLGIAFLNLDEADQERVFAYTLQVERTLAALTETLETGRTDSEEIEALMEKVPFMRKYPKNLRKVKAAFELEAFGPKGNPRSARA